MTVGIACYHLHWKTYTVGLRQAWHAIIAFGLHTRSDNVGRVMPSSPLECTYTRTKSGVTFHHRPWTVHTVRQGRLSIPARPLGSTHVQMTWNVVYDISLGQHTQ